jgi:hypothetical protein
MWRIERRSDSRSGSSQCELGWHHSTGGWCGRFGDRGDGRCCRGNGWRNGGNRRCGHRDRRWIRTHVGQLDQHRFQTAQTLIERFGGGRPVRRSNAGHGRRRRGNGDGRDRRRHVWQRFREFDGRNRRGPPRSAQRAAFSWRRWFLRRRFVRRRERRLLGRLGIIGDRQHGFRDGRVRGGLTIGDRLRLHGDGRDRSRFVGMHRNGNGSGHLRGQRGRRVFIRDAGVGHGSLRLGAGGQSGSLGRRCTGKANNSVLFTNSLTIRSAEGQSIGVTSRFWRAGGVSPLRD